MSDRFSSPSWIATRSGSTGRREPTIGRVPECRPAAIDALLG
jgi:hypothetical protein